MRTWLSLGVVFLLGAGAGFAQEPTKVEIGSSLGATMSVGSGDTEVLIGLPTPSFIGTPAVYVSWFATRSLMIEPQLGIGYTTVSQQVLLNSSLQVGYLFVPRFYVAANIGYSRFGTFVQSATAGAGFGYRTVVLDHLALRAETRYRRWLCDGCSLNELSFLIGFGTALP